jgi:acetyl-CoA C-acetyltransferase
MGRYCGKLKDFTAQELGAIAAKEALRRAQVEPDEIDHAVFGNAQQTSGDALYGARHVAHRGAGADGEPAVRLGDAVHCERRADDPTG